MVDISSGVNCVIGVSTNGELWYRARVDLGIMIGLLIIKSIAFRLMGSWLISAAVITVLSESQPTVSSGTEPE